MNLLKQYQKSSSLFNYVDHLSTINASNLFQDFKLAFPKNKTKMEFIVEFTKNHQRKPENFRIFQDIQLNS